MRKFHPGRFRFCFFGRIGEYKGLDLLVNAIAGLDDETRLKMRRLLIVGPAAFDIESIMDDARRVMNEDLFVRIEFVPEGHLQAYLDAADIVVFSLS